MFRKSNLMNKILVLEGNSFFGRIPIPIAIQSYHSIKQVPPKVKNLKKSHEFTLQFELMVLNFFYNQVVFNIFLFNF